MLRTRPAAVLFDLDGTLVDTEPYWIEAEEELVEAHGGVWTREHAMQLVGNDLLSCARYISEHGGVALTPPQIVDHLIARVVARVEHMVPWRPGGRELLADLRAHHVPCALVTMSYAPLVVPVLAGLPKGTFDVVVTGDVVSQSKPHPEPYLHAARLLGVEPARCIAVEDSNTGARSADAAGCLVVVVENHVPVAPGGRRVFLPTLEGLSAHSLAELEA